MQYNEQLQTQKKTIQNAVQTVFQGFNLEKDFSDEKYKIIDATTNKTCLQFEFKDHESIKKVYPTLSHNPRFKDLTVLHISVLSKCGSANSGNRLLALVDELAKSIPFVEYITLTDASTIRTCDVELNLNELKILTSETGESWYNRWGYKSPTNHYKNLSSNLVLRNENMSEFLDRIPLFKTELQAIFPEVDINTTVHQYVKSISEQIRSFPTEEEQCSEPQIHKTNVMNMLINELNVYYAKGLVKNVSRGGSKRSANKRCEKKKHKTKKRLTKKMRITREAKK